VATNLVIPEKNDEDGQFEEPIDVHADGLAANGFYPQNATSNDMAAGMERDSSGNLILKDSISGSKALSALISSDPYNFLLDCEPDSVGVTYSITRSSGLVTKETWTNTSTSKDIKTIDYTRSSGLLATEVVKVFDSDGTTVVAQKTVTYSRSGSLVSGATITRDV